MYRTKKSQIVVAVMLVLALLAACAPKPAPTATPEPAVTKPTEAPPTEEPSVTVHFMAWDVGMGDPEVIKKDILEPFEKETGIHVELELATWDMYWDKIKTMIAGGNPPDVFMQSYALAYEFAAKDFVENLQPLWDRDMNPDDYYMELTTGGRIHRYPDANGDLYAVPFRFVDSALVYNKDMFDAAGLEYPNTDWTYDDFLEAAKALTKDTDGDGEIDQWGTIAFNDWIFPDTIIHAWGGQVISEDFSKCMLTHPKSIEAMQWVVDLIHKHKVAPPMDLAASPGWVQVGPFATGKIAMSLQGAWYFADFRDRVEFDWDLTMIPIGPAGRYIHGGPDNIAIAKGAQHKEEAWAFIKYLLSEKTTVRALGVGAVPFNKALANSEEWLEPGKKPEHKTIIIESAPYIFLTDIAPGWLEWAATIKLNELAPAFLGEKSVEEAAAAACAGIDEVFAEWQ